jgi:DNA-binding response OmpR family regulator
VTRRIPLDDEHEFAFWKTEQEAEAKSLRRVLVGHKDKAIGESLCILLALKGYEAVYARDTAQARLYLRCWAPHALLLDTRLDAASDYQFIQTIRADAATVNVLILAMSNIWPLDSVLALRKAGFDGHCRRPCSLWRIVDLLDGHFVETVKRRGQP